MDHDEHAPLNDSTTSGAAFESRDSDKSRRRRLGMVLVILVSLGAGIGVGDLLFRSHTGGAVHPMRSIAFSDEVFGATCKSAPSVDHFYNGEVIRVVDGFNKPISAGVVTSQKSGHDVNSSGHRVKTCTFHATILVPINLPVYDFVPVPSVGTTNGVAFTFGQLRGYGWQAPLVLND